MEIEIPVSSNNSSVIYTFSIQFSFLKQRFRTLVIANVRQQGESEQENVLKDPYMLKRLTEIEKMEDTDKGNILSVIDGFIKSIKLKNIAALN